MHLQNLVTSMALSPRMMRHFNWMRIMKMHALTKHCWKSKNRNSRNHRLMTSLIKTKTAIVKISPANNKVAMTKINRITARHPTSLAKVIKIITIKLTQKNPTPNKTLSRMLRPLTIKNPMKPISLPLTQNRLLLPETTKHLLKATNSKLLHVLMTSRI